jgi:5-methylcytosine-specific restriction protein A
VIVVRPCTTFGCGAWVPGGGPCRKHRPKDDRPSAAARGYGKAWQATRRRFLLVEHFRCDIADCQQPATDVHHLDGLGPLGPLGHAASNLQALCHAHHSQITAREVFRK